jgi:hypothetical protein
VKTSAADLETLVVVASRWVTIRRATILLVKSGI